LVLYFIYVIYTTVLGLILIAVVPREQIRRLSFWGIALGAGADFALLLVLGKLLGVVEYLNFGPFGFMGIPFFPLLAWSVFFIMFLYFLPPKKFVYFYVAAAAVYATWFSNILENLGIFKWNCGNLVVPYVIYFTWFGVAVFVYQKIEKD